MRHRLHDVGVRPEGLGDQKLAIARGGQALHMDMDPLLQKAVLHLQKTRPQDADGVTLVVGVEGVHDPRLVVQEDKLGRRAAAVDADISVHLAPRVQFPEDIFVLVEGVAPDKLLIFRVIGKKGLCQPARTLHGLSRPADQGPDAVDAAVDVLFLFRPAFSAGIERRAQGDHELGLVWQQDVLVPEVELLAEGLHQGRMEAERAALEDDGRRHGQALGQTADGLLGDGVQGRQGDVLLADALVEQGLDIRLGIDAAAAGDVVDLRPLLRQRLILLGLHLQERGDLVDKGARPAGTGPVHAHVRHLEPAGLRVRAEKDHLGVLAAQLNGRLCGGVMLHDRQGIGDHLLDKGHARRVREGLGA